MKISATQTGFALYKEADIIGQCDVTPTPKGADITALSVLPQWRRNLTWATATPSRPTAA